MRHSADRPELPPHTLALPDADATAGLGTDLWRAWDGRQCVVALQGDLGAGKTTLVRGLLRAAGHTGPVRSPTYTLMEPYDLGDRRVLHLDLYRLADPGELDFLGLRDELADGVLVLVEWPERGVGVMPPWGLEVGLSDHGDGRCARVVGHDSAGERLARCLLGVCG
ncbi:tRNA (adenosine(37)-N6)-threonylcarbamoyltransferase complex ATPase subunit type 1 TsaE [Aquisalimonas sp. 2447]|uniref:tRNA (adenosine(37)-N6)-threonylcarbamoyltransferase complex ATPase subunit type 1 TsaE n=1 Tax=Aquisalimonas sp. 2447 TaxID=2740807 RepID=UPI00143254F2|nr:tRNA (adenosine(37)-N6)-threonylcarbamoyltransferase complex ATPase subunit type 1 TsaE [Aquisalimonas sp. 2447]QIT56020.1 tRNA (adenosine(37)-N6)-threonylcarbamoyltransferase complex ATPase subunit type 1 TsaE [Aquisalimonas sp. 2447]